VAGDSCFKDSDLTHFGTNGTRVAPLGETPRPHSLMNTLPQALVPTDRFSKRFGLKSTDCPAADRTKTQVLYNQPNWFYLVLAFRIIHPLAGQNPIPIVMVQLQRRVLRLVSPLGVQLWISGLGLHHFLCICSLLKQILVYLCKLILRNNDVLRRWLCGGLLRTLSAVTFVWSRFIVPLQAKL